MKHKLLCGNACIQFILKKEGKLLINSQKKIKWVPELAIELKKAEVKNINIICFNSKLFSDYKNFKKENKVLLAFEEAEKLKIPISKEKLTKKRLEKEMSTSKYIILCVESSKFHKDSKMNGGHFIILIGKKGNKIKVINPTKTKYKELLCTKSFLIKCCKKYGQWRILIGEDCSDKSNSI